MASRKEIRQETFALLQKLEEGHKVSQNLLQQAIMLCTEIHEIELTVSRVRTELIEMLERSSKNDSTNRR